MAPGEESDWKLMATRTEGVLADLEAAAAAALAQRRYRPGIKTLAAEVARLRSAIVALVQRQIAVHAIWDEAYESGRQGPKSFLAVSLENTPFSVAEQAQVSDQMQKIKNYITTTYELTADQISDIKEKIDHVEEASSRLNRKDWLMLFNGAMFSLVLAGIIPPQAVQHILLLVFNSLGYLFGVGGPPTSLPLQAVVRFVITRGAASSHTR